MEYQANCYHGTVTVSPAESLDELNSFPPSATYMRQWIGKHIADNGLSPIWCQAII